MYWWTQTFSWLSWLVVKETLLSFNPKIVSNCKYNFFKECNCNEDGSSSFVCDKATGQCTCNELVTGETCDKCQDGYFDFPNPCKGMYYLNVYIYAAELIHIPWSILF